MKKILLATMPLIGATALFAGSAVADPLKITLGGYESVQAGYVNDDMDRNATTTQAGSKQRPIAYRSDTQVDFKIDGKNDAGLGYGGEIDLNADTTDTTKSQTGTNASKTFIFMSGDKWGRFEMGSEVGADGTMKVDAGTIARATGGVDGDWSYFANAGDQYLAMTQLPLAYGTLSGSGTNNFTGNHNEENINKITYYTPRFVGVQMGLSFSPDLSNRGQGTFAGNGTAPAGLNRGIGDTVSNVWSGGINYENKFGDVGVAAAVTGEYGRADNAANEDLRAWNAGAKASWMGWSLAGSYGSWGKSLTATDSESKDTWYADAGIAYGYGPFGASVTYMHSQFDCGRNAADVAGGGGGSTTNTGSCQSLGKNKFDNISAGVDYKLASGLTPYTEVTWYKENSASTAVESLDNKGVLGIVGTQLNF